MSLAGPEDLGAAGMRGGDSLPMSSRVDGCCYDAAE